MDGLRSGLTVVLFVVVMAAIVGSAFATSAFDDYYYGPLCQRYGDETGMEFVSVIGGTRRSQLRCTFRLYNDDGSFRAMVDVPVGRIQGWPVNIAMGSLRWLIMAGVIVPAVWLAQKFKDDD
jgi:hypothetical protein